MVIWVMLLFLQLGNAMLLARVLGVEQFGAYSFAFSIVQILTIVSTLGGQSLLVREVASYNTQGKFGAVRGLLIRFRQVSILVSLLLMLGGWVVVFVVAEGDRSWARWPLFVALTMVPLQSMLILNGAVLLGNQRVVLGQLWRVVRPALFIATIMALAWGMGRTLLAEHALGAQVVVTTVVVAAFWIVLRSTQSRDVRNATPEFETRRWFLSAMPMLMANGMLILNNQTSVVMLGVLGDPESVALFRVAQRGADVVPLGLLAVGMAVGPTIAELFARKDNARLQQVVSKSLLAVIAFAGPVALVLVIAGGPLIHLFFGTEYRMAYTPLVIMCGGQLVNCALGYVGVLLNMMRLERVTAQGVGIALLINVALCLVLIPSMGVIGAAISTAASLIVWNVFLCVMLYRKTGIVSAIRWPR